MNDMQDIYNELRDAEADAQVIAEAVIGGHLIDWRMLDDEIAMSSSQALTEGLAAMARGVAQRIGNVCDMLHEDMSVGN